MSTDYSKLLKDALLEIRQLRGDLETLENAQHEPLAIIGVSGRYPGSPNVDAYWQMLRTGGNPVAEIPQARWDMGQFYDPDMKRPSGAISSNLACLLDEIATFDAPFFGISPREAKRLDPQQRMMLEVTWEALEHAGYDPAKLNGSNTAIYIGAGNSDYNVMQMYPRSAIDAYVGTGSSRSLLANRLSYILNFHGASMSIDTACSSSLVAIDLAARALRNRETDLAVAGGVSLILSPDLSITFSHANMLAPDGRCKTFDASADGYVRGEGVGAIILKRLSDAQRDNDTILALVRGTAVNQDGRSNGLTAPNGVAQELVIKAALLNAGLTAADIHYVEAHGTGTSLGDPIEMSALGNVYGRAHSKDNPFYAASVKTNIGHLEGAAGVAGVTKVLLAMQHRAIPPHLHFTNPSPYINWKKIPVVIPTELTPIPDDLVFRAGVSSFGFGGTNSHVILETAPVDERPAQPQRPQIVVKLSARTDAALNQMAAGYAAALDQSPAALADLAYTANAGRSDHPLRAAVVGATREELRDKLLQLATGSTPAGTVRGEAEAPAEVVFAFTGQGSQAVGMGRDLYEHEPIFRAALDEVAALLDPHLTRPILSVIYPRAGDETLINQTTYTQPALFAIEYALAQLWMSWGILPAAVTGHSVGEYVAAVLAGVFSLADGAKLIAARARLMGALPTGGTMAACLTDETTVTAAIAPYAGKVAIGAINSPTETVISGEKEAVSAVIATLSAQKIRCVELTVSHAFHSPLMEPMLDAFYNVAVTIAYQLPNLPYASNLTGALASGEVATPDYWVQHVREAVRFADGARALYAANYRTFLEVGARPILSGLGKRIFNDPLVKWVPSLRPERDAWQQLGESLAALYIAGANIAWENVQRGYTVPLPSYPFQRQRYWYIEGGATLSANYQDPVTTDATGGVPTGDVVAEVALPGAVSREMLSAFEDAYNAETPIFNPNAADSEIWRRMTQADPNDRRVIMVEYLRGQVAGVLGMPVDQVGEKHRFFDLGMDSLMSVELKNRLEADLGHNLSLTLAFDYPNIGKLADYILNDVLAFANAPVVVATQEARPMIANEPIAVIGMACRLPGNSDSPEQFWDLLINGRDAVTAIPTDRWDADELYDANVHAAGKSYVRAGAFLNTPPDEFDPLFFGISPREAASIDPQHRLLLEMAWESLENAGQSPTELEGSTTGVYVGINTQDYLHLIHSAGLDAIDSAMTTGTTFSASAGRISYALGLEGPSMAIDTACSASLVGIHLAASALRNGECDLALAGGVSLMLSPVTTVGMSRLQALAPDGRCKTFDADADGYGRGEGAGMVVLKRLSDAQRDGDRVLALVRGSAVNQDGASGGLTVPNGPSQQTVIKAALKAAGLQPHDVDYVEAHGTGTSLGDPIEISALANALGRGRAPENPLLVGSAKTNIGHLESGAGIAGFIKLVLSLQHGVIPPHINMNKPSPNIEWDRLPIKITTEPTAWVATPNKPRIAGISSFGFTGTNAHVIVEEAPRMVIPAADVDRTHHVLALSARSEAALYDLAASYANLLANDPTINLGDLTYTANVGRAHFDYRLAVTTESASALEQALRAELSITKIPKTAPKLAWMFTGQGAQSVGMARELYMTSPTFRQALDQCASRLSEYLEQPLLGVIFNEDANNPLIHHTGYTQPALFAVEYALAQLWLSWGIRPDAVTGHSVGEVVAATVAGVFSLDDAIKLIAARGRLMGALPAGGTMAACITDEKTAAAAIAPFAGKVALAGLNSPTETVISGEKAAVQQAIAALKAQGIRCVELSVSHAFHSPLMEPMLAEFRAVVSEISFHAPQLPLVSNVTGQMADPAQITTPDYWVQHVREAVRFADGLRALHAYGIRAFLEVGPKPVLTNLAKRTLEDDGLLLATSLNPRVADWQALLDSVGMLYTAGFNVQWRGLDQDTPRRKITLPTYRFQRKPYWFTERNPQAAEDRRWRNMADWFYQIEWQPQPLPPSLNGRTAGRWLVFGFAGDRLTDALVNRLREQGATVELVIPSNAFGGTAGFSGANGQWSIRADNADDLTRLLQSVKSNLKGVAFLWNLYQPEQITLDTLSENHNTALTAALHLARELPKLNIKEARLWFVSRGAQAVGISSVSEAGLAQAPLWGLARVVTLEHPETFGAVIDLDPENLTDEAAALVDDLLHADGEDQIAYRDGERYAVRLQPLAENEQPRQTVTLRADAAYLITGGFGKLGLKVAEYLVRHGAKHLVLTSRRGLPDRATWTQPTDDSTREAINGVLLLESLGATVYPAAADVTDVDGMGAVFAAFGNTLPALAGIVHAAGLLDSAYIADLTAEQMQRVLRPKVQGTWVLHQLSEHLPLDFFLQFSSASSTWGSAMAAHYVAANHFQDIFAHYRRKRGLTAQAINWGWWDGGGMVSTEEQTYFDGIGLKIMPQADGLSAMGHFLATHPVQVTVAPVDWSRYKPVFEAKRLRPFLQRIIVQASADDSSGADAALLAEIAEMPASERPLRLILLVQQTLAALLRIESPALIDPQGGFFDLGLDSLTSIELRSTLERTLGLDLPATVAFEYSTAETMATFLLNSLPDMGGSDAAPEPITYTPSVSLTSWTDATPQAAPDLDSMSDDELLALLEQELGAD